MSRGHGILQRWILQELERKPGPMSTRSLAEGWYGPDPARGQMAVVRQAALRLVDEGLLQVWTNQVAAEGARGGLHYSFTRSPAPAGRGG
jgi:hypothetical protein